MNMNHDVLREALELLRIFKNNLGPNRAALTAEDAILWDRVEALSQHRAALEECVGLLNRLPWNEGYADEVDAAIAHSNQVLEGGKACPHNKTSK